MNDRYPTYGKGIAPGIRPLIYRSVASLASEDAARVAFLVLRELMASSVHYDVVHRALRESAVHDWPSMECPGEYSGILTDQINAIADALFSRFAEDAVVHAALSAISMIVLADCTVPPPPAHLTDAQMDAYRACCAGSHAGAGAALSYETYASYRAHLAACHGCDRRLLARAVSA
jgi:hypothetical protein